MIEHLAVAIVSAIAFLGAILLYGAFSPRRLEGWKFWLCFAAYCVLMEGNGFLANELFSVCGAVGDGVGRQTLYNVIRYALLYALLFRERPVIYLSVPSFYHPTYHESRCLSITKPNNKSGILLPLFDPFRVGFGQKRNQLGAGVFCAFPRECQRDDAFSDLQFDGIFTSTDRTGRIIQTIHGTSRPFLAARSRSFCSMCRS